MAPYGHDVKVSLRDIALSTFHGYFSNFLLVKANKVELSALCKLSRKTYVAILCPDKGNGTVVLNKNDYINKAVPLLSDSCKFKKIDVGVLYLCIKHAG